MVQPAKFRNIEFEWDEGNIEELIRHGIHPEEAEECFFNKYRITRNKRKAGAPMRRLNCKVGLTVEERCGLFSSSKKKQP